MRYLPEMRDENSQLAVQNTGSIKYVARLRSSQAYSIAGSALGRQYGLTQYDNTANLVNDKGAEFSSTHADFEDSFILDRTAYEGWVIEEDGSAFYYIRNKKVTGLQYLPENYVHRDCTRYRQPHSPLFVC